MHVEFLLGPAGSGKTFECLRQAREALTASAEGSRLLFIAPKQATYQLERQLLSDERIPGFTRLHIVSFERVANLILSLAKRPQPKLLSDEGRVMVLKGLLARHEKQFKWFHASAHFHGFAQELSQLIGRFHQAGWSPAMLLNLSITGRLAGKLADLALIWKAYEHWLQQEQLQDGDLLLQYAAEALAQSRALQFDSLWLDGFARFTSQEQRLIQVLVRHCRRATLAFCLDGPRTSEPWHSHWCTVHETVNNLKNDLQRIQGVPVRLRSLGNQSAQLELLPSPGNSAGAGRFRSAELQHLETNWSRPRPYAAAPLKAVRLVECPSREAEIRFVAREILRHVRTKSRFRNVAVLVRRLDDYHDLFRRIFLKYEIPFFLDRREPVSHHPLAVLTRGALKTIAFHWRQSDWFTALKTGLMPASQPEIDQLENEALARGWDGATWQKRIVIRNNPGLERTIEAWRQKLLPPFQNLAETLGPTPDGTMLRAGLRAFWKELQVQKTLDQWGQDDEESRRLHESVWEQMQQWADSVALAFRAEKQSLTQWIPILEAGLESLTVGVIPPVLDQVLVGSVDRSRNPDLECVFVLGLNEGVFPARPVAPVILTEAERQLLGDSGSPLDPNSRQQAGFERYLGYIACTRASHNLIATYALRDIAGTALNRSSLAMHLQRLFPSLRQPEKFHPDEQWTDAEHYTELIAPLLKLEHPRTQALGAGGIHRTPLSTLREFAPIASALRKVAESDPPAPSLSAKSAEKLYGRVHQTSISALEKFGQCPFRFFVDSGLRAQERVRFTLDARKQGTFQHEVLERFHRHLLREGKTWHQTSPPEAREKLGRIADETMADFADGMMMSSEENRFFALESKERLQNFVELLVEWMDQYQFEPTRVEWSFGMPGSELPPWKIDLEDGRALELRGKIDRLDIYRSIASDEALCVIMDYKAGPRDVNRLLLDRGVEMQLPAYIAAIRRIDAVAETLGLGKLRPVGGFFVNLRGQYKAAENRDEALADHKRAHKEAFQHRGLFDVTALPALDRRQAEKGDQFKYTRKKDGSVATGGKGPMRRADFEGVLDAIEEQIRHFGRSLLNGRVAVDPYKAGKATACDWCEHAGICRIDPWQHAYRNLRAGEPDDT